MAESTTRWDNDSASNSSEFYPLVKQTTHVVVIFSLAYSLIFVFAFIGNLMVITVVVRNKSMHTVTNYFIANLAFSDLLVAIFCVPITLLVNLFNGWHFGAVLCKATPFLQGVSIGASVNTLAAIAVDRNLAICYTLQFRVTRKVCRLIIAIIWICVLAGFTPWALFYTHARYPSTLQEIYICYPDWPRPQDERHYFLFVFLVFYIIPLIVVSICYGMIGFKVWNRNAPGISNTSGVIYNSKVRTVKMLLLVFVFFTLSWMPLYSIHMWKHFSSDRSQQYPVIENIIKPIAQWLGQANSGINPVIYCFFSKKFRTGFLAMAPRSRCCSRKVPNNAKSTVYSSQLPECNGKQRGYDSSISGVYFQLSQQNLELTSSI